jgi:hypothetical protein
MMRKGARAMTKEQTRIADLIVEVQREFLAGATLTTLEIQQRVGTDAITCEALLATLVDAGVLMRLDDLYTRAWPAGPEAPPKSDQLAA